MGEGSIVAKGSEKGFSLAGDLKLDEKIFDGSIHAEYSKEGDNEKWKISGTAKLKKMTGIKSGTITASYDGKTLQAKGDVDLDIKGGRKRKPGSGDRGRYISYQGKIHPGKITGYIKW